MAFRPLLALLAVASLASGQQPPAPKVSGYRVTAEGGVEGTRTVRYDADGRPLDGSPRADSPRPEPAPAAALPAPRAPRAVEPAPAAPGAARSLRTADGRPLPFTLTGPGGKTVDESVDADAALRDFGRPSDLLSRRFQADRVDLGLDDRFATGNVVTLGTYGTFFSGLGERRADVALVDGLGAEVRAKDTVDVRSVERRASPWSRRSAEVAGWDERVGGEADLSARRVDEASLAGTVARANAEARSPRTLDQLSMQDINRYQFRRARSTEPGLPAVRPGSGGEVRSTRPN